MATWCSSGCHPYCTCHVLQLSMATWCSSGCHPYCTCHVLQLSMATWCSSGCYPYCTCHVLQLSMATWCSSGCCPYCKAYMQHTPSSHHGIIVIFTLLVWVQKSPENQVAQSSRQHMLMHNNSRWYAVVSCPSHAACPTQSKEWHWSTSVSWLCRSWMYCLTFQICGALQMSSFENTAMLHPSRGMMHIESL